MTKFIGCPQLENLLKKYKTIQGLAYSLGAELSAFLEQGSSEDERLVSMAIGNRAVYMEDTPITSASEPGAKVTKILNDYHDVIDREDQEAVKEILADIRVVNLILKKIDCGLNSLPEIQRIIVESKFIKSYTWGMTSDAARMSEGHCKMLNKQALEQMLKIVRIRWSDYEKVNILIGEG